MEVILLERVGKLGQMGDVVRVKDGFARNFLLPRGKALRATADNKARFEGMKVELQARNLELKGGAEKLAAKLDGKTIVVIRQASEAGQLFGSVSTARHRQPAQRRTAPRSAARRSRSTRRSRPSASTRCRWRCIRKSRPSSPSSSRAAPTKPSASRAARTSPCGASEAEEEAAAALAAAEAFFEPEAAKALREDDERRKPRLRRSGADQSKTAKAARREKKKAETKAGRCSTESAPQSASGLSGLRLRGARLPSAGFVAGLVGVASAWICRLRLGRLGARRALASDLRLRTLVGSCSVGFLASARRSWPRPACGLSAFGFGLVGFRLAFFSSSTLTSSLFLRRLWPSLRLFSSPLAVRLVAPRAPAWRGGGPLAERLQIGGDGGGRFRLAV